MYRQAGRKDKDLVGNLQAMEKERPEELLGPIANFCQECPVLKLSTTNNFTQQAVQHSSMSLQCYEQSQVYSLYSGLGTVTLAFTCLTTIIVALLPLASKVPSARKRKEPERVGL